MEPKVRLARPAFFNAGIGWGLLALTVIGLSLAAAGLFQRELFNPNGLPLLGRFWAASLQPDLSPEFLRLVLSAALTTLAYAVCGTALSVALGLVGGLLASEAWWSAVWRRSRPGWVGGTVAGVRLALAVPRSIHEMIWGLFFVNIFGLDPLVAVLAITLPYGAIVAKIFSEILDETPRQPLESLLNSGVAPLTAFCYSLIPQAFLDLLSYTFYRFECAIRSAAVLGIIGAGGLGYEILLSLQSLRYAQLWTLFYSLFLLNGLVDWGSAWLRQRLGSPSRIELNFRHRSAKAMPRPSIRRDPLLALVGVGIVALIPASFWYIQADFSKLWAARTLTLLTDVGRSTFPIALNAAQLRQLVDLSLQTLAMSVLAIAIAAVGGMLLSFPAAHNFFLPGGLLMAQRQRAIGKVGAWALLLVSRALLLMGRAIPAPIWALVALFVLFPGILPGAIALGVHNLGIVGRLMAEVTENLDQRPLAALKAQGVPAPLIFLYGVLPLTLTRFLAYVLYRWEVCMRETVIVGLVGAGGLGRVLTEQLSSFDYGGILVTLGCFGVLTFGVDWLSGSARRAFRAGATSR
ncbi:ABC transporter permease subunit [Phormidium tenue FACHB-886]|nr:ABC transporter permease subunit [Phormidium tenue FACHB-886]